MRREKEGTMSFGILTGLVTGGAAMSATMAALWKRQRRTKNAGTVDVAWAVGTGVLGATVAALGSGDRGRRALVAAMIVLWSARLSSHLVRRMREDGEEDRRYAYLRERWGDKTDARLFWFFQLQASWVVLFALPIVGPASNPSRLGGADVAGVLLFTGALALEALADEQLQRFRSDPKNRGRVCDVGLWRLSRHPNYFFEWLHWCSYVLLSVGSPRFGFSLVGPIVVYLFLTRLTGIPFLEARSIEHRGDAYREYQARTSRFFPIPKIRKQGAR
jgi:steroid 5-alpha reductase family enzyme